MQALKFAIDVYGLSSIELVPSYLILGEASIGWFGTTLDKYTYKHTQLYKRSI